MDDEITISDVKLVKSNTVNSSWKGFIQVVTTDKGIFYDNPESITYAYNKKTLGFDWKKYINIPIKYCLVSFVHNRGIIWIKNDKNLL